ncbi:TetR/AcrR family transcriptional regulator [Caballeronia sp. ATUFL_M1_KS5A]|uniref:TetR/AcrR family transcriptional regulator n=1 Tax=Caballeronia sp. ATUFL_M1_KS5A TaxID=2921778 RepID=UPI0020292EB8
MGETSTETREMLIRTGLEMLSERGLGATGIEQVLKKCGVPKGSFYYYFSSKNAFGHEVIDRYDALWRRRLDRIFLDASVTARQRVETYIADSIEGLRKFQYRRGCLIGNVAAELSGLDDSFRHKITAILDGWKNIVARCVQDGIDGREFRSDIEAGEIAEFFWTAWEGAILRAKLDQSPRHLEAFGRLFLQMTEPTQRTH